MTREVPTEHTKEHQSITELSQKLLASSLGSSSDASVAKSNRTEDTARLYIPDLQLVDARPNSQLNEIREFSLEPKDFGKLPNGAGEVLREHGVKGISVIPKPEGKAIIVALGNRQEIPLDPGTGCSKIIIGNDESQPNKITLRIEKHLDGNIALSNVHGLGAEVILPILGKKTVELRGVEIKPGPDGTSQLNVAVEYGFLKHTVSLQIDKNLSDNISNAIRDLDKLKDCGSGHPVTLEDRKLADRHQEEDTSYIRLGLSLLTIAGATILADRVRRQFYPRETAGATALKGVKTRDKATDRTTDRTTDKSTDKAADKATNKTTNKSPNKTTAQPVDAAMLPRIGDQVEVKGEKLKVAGYEGNHALLHKPGRNLGDAVIAKLVTDAELKSKYQDFKVHMDGKQQSLYIEKGHPERGVYCLVDIAGQKSKSLFPDRSFEVVRTSDLTGAARMPAAGRVETPAIPPGDKSRPGENKTDRGTGEKPSERPPDADIRKAKYGDGRAANERVCVIDGKEVKVRTPEDAEGAGMRREVEIDGKTIELHRVSPPKAGQQWYYSEKGFAKIDKGAEQVKLHVTGVSAADLARLQKVLIPALEQMRLKGSVSQYKTFDPNFMDGKWQDHPDKYGQNPGPDGQNSKAFTIYVPPEKAQEVASAIDKILKEKGLTLDGFQGDNVAERTRLQSQSRRVSVERDMWTLSRDHLGRDGALLDEGLAKSLHERYSKSHGVDSEGRLTNESLRAAEKAAGIARGQLTYNKDGLLMFVDKNGGSKKTDSRRFYADESQANKEKGRMTGRPALYALYETAGLEPAKVYTDQIKTRQEKLASTEHARPDRIVPKAERLQGTDTRAETDGTLRRENTRPGELFAREQLDRRKSVDQKEIDALKRNAEELAKSDKQADREKARALSKTVDALEGKHGQEAQQIAHKAILDESRKALERGNGGGYGRAVVGGLIGIGILTAAALACR